MHFHLQVFILRISLVAIRSLRDIVLAIVVKKIVGIKTIDEYDMFGLLE